MNRAAGQPHILLDYYSESKDHLNYTQATNERNYLKTVKIASSADY